MLRPLMLRTSVRLTSLLALGVALAASACGESGAIGAMEGDTTDIAAVDTASFFAAKSMTRVKSRAPMHPPRALSPLADSVGRNVTFLGSFQRSFVAAGRGGRILVDIGRIDTKLATSAERRAFEEAAGVLAPLRIGDRLRLRGSWGASDVTVAGYDEWKGRAVATLLVPPVVDSLARSKGPLVALAVRVDSAAADSAVAADSCARRDAGPSPQLAARRVVVEDSVARILRSDMAGVPAAHGAQEKLPPARVTRVNGCFGSGAMVIFANARIPGRETAREIAVLLDTLGNVTPLEVSDLRFKTHEALRAFDADGDGVDDVAALGRAGKTGGTVVLRLDPAKRRLTYVMSGFAWETF